ncbi:DUF2795 domain-containing protein [Halovivax sp.]|uniref:DUF2795 domain-containing protein n=1 Tax=Halovivax sp. TaxID=1935978 RepID=UPI0025BA85DE|nr:DUF2795 domain-containing protein [Halovivax sp.]
MQMNGTTAFADGLEYPATTEELIESHGDRTIELPNGSETVADALGRISSETFETPEDVDLTLQCALSRKAIGRIGYSDRDPAPLGSPYAPDQLSF